MHCFALSENQVRSQIVDTDGLTGILLFYVR